MTRTHLNFWIDTAAFLQLALLATTGLLMRYTLPPGSGRSATVWGFDRHDWGSVHFWVAAGFLATLGVHLVLHGKWIACVVGGKKSGAYRARLTVGAAALAIALLLAASPLLARVARTTPAEPHERPQATEHHGAELINGRTSLMEVERLTGVPVSTLCEKLGLPNDVRPTDPLGQLCRRHGFKMQDVRDAVAIEARETPSEPHHGSHPLDNVDPQQPKPFLQRPRGQVAQQ